MYIIKNAFDNLKRNTGRNLLMGLIVYGIIVITALAMQVDLTAKAILTEYKTQFGSEVTIVNRADRSDAEKNKPLRSEILLSFGQSDLIQSVVYSARIAVAPVEIQTAGAIQQKSVNDGQKTKGALYGSSNENINEEFEKGIRKIKQGRLYKKGARECVVSEKFAERNHLSTGDKISFESTLPENPMRITLTISGVYEDKSLGNSSDSAGGVPGDRDNDFFTDFDTIYSSKIFKSYGIMDIKLFLKDPDMLEQLKKELAGKGLPEYYEVLTDTNTYRTMAMPVEKLARVSNILMVSVLICGCAILILLSLMSIRERKYEVGVLRAIGMKKGKIALGLITEAITIVSICLVLGLGSAALARKPVSQMLVSSQTQSTALEENRPSVESIPLDSKSMGEIAGLSLALALVSSMSGILFVMRFEPSKILSDRN